MSIPKIGPEELAVLASEQGKTIAEIVDSMDDSICQQWADLEAALPRPIDSLIAASTIKFTLSLARVAQTELHQDRPRVRVNLGIAQWCNLFARSITPFFSRSDASNDEVEQMMARSADLLSYAVGWLSSPAGHPRELFRDDFSPEREVSSMRLADASMMFVLAHEMGHIHAREFDREPSVDRAHKREHAADAWAIRHLVALDRVNRDWPLRLTLGGSVLFLCAEVIREAYAQQVQNFSHPKALERMQRVQSLLLECASPPDLEAAGAIATFYSVMAKRYLEPRSPDALVTDSGFQSLVTQLRISPPSPAGRTTWRELYQTIAIEAVRYCGRKQLTRYPATDAEVDALEFLAHKMPSVVIEVLVAAYEGRLLQDDDPDCAGVNEFGQTLFRRFSDPWLREAIVTL